MPWAGLAKSLSQLIRYPDVVKSIQRAHASNMLRRMLDRLETGTLTSRDVEQAIDSVPGKTLKQFAHGEAILSLIHSVAFLYERSPARAVAVVEPANRDTLTKTVARDLKLAAFEYQGSVKEADGLLSEILAESPPEERKKRIYQNLGGLNVEKGMIAVAHADIEPLEVAAERFIALEKEAKQLGLSDALQSAIAIARDALNGNFESVQKAFDVPEERAAKHKRIIEGDNKALNRLTEGKAIACLEEFAETVRLLAIEDPLDRWNELAQLIGREWPEGLSAEEAVRQIRE